MARGSGKFRGFRRRWAADEHSPYESGLPIAGCKCRTCEAERTAQHYARMGDVVGLASDEPNFDPDPKGGTK